MLSVCLFFVLVLLILVLICVDCMFHFMFFFFKQKTAYEMRISDWSSACALPISLEPFRCRKDPSEPQHTYKYRSDVASVSEKFLRDRWDLFGNGFDVPVPHPVASLLADLWLLSSKCSIDRWSIPRHCLLDSVELPFCSGCKEIGRAHV